MDIKTGEYVRTSRGKIFKYGKGEKQYIKCKEADADYCADCPHGIKQDDMKYTGERKIARKCCKCEETLYEDEIAAMGNARGYGFYIICNNCGWQNVIQEIDLTREFL